MRLPVLALILLSLNACADLDDPEGSAAPLDEGDGGPGGGPISFGPGVPLASPTAGGAPAYPAGGAPAYPAGGASPGTGGSGSGGASAGGAPPGAGGTFGAAGGAQAAGAGGAEAPCPLPPFCPAGGGTGAGGASAAGGATGGGGAEAESLPGFTPLPANPKECPVGAPANPVGLCLGLPIYLGCNYTNGQRQYSCVCDWYHWLCI